MDHVESKYPHLDSLHYNLSKKSRFQVHQLYKIKKQEIERAYNSGHDFTIVFCKLNVTSMMTIKWIIAIVQLHILDGNSEIGAHVRCNFWFFLSG